MAVDDIDYAAYIVRHLTERAATAEREGQNSEVERFVLAHGRTYHRMTAIQPEPMTANSCHENAAVFSRTPGMIYVEGFALVAVPALFAFAHAWCIDADGCVFEVTWREPGLAYFGVAFAPEYVGRRMASPRHPEHGLLRGNGCGALFDGEEKDWRA
jgi:hypothetical protein